MGDMPVYPKINGIFKRDRESGENHNKFIPGDYSRPEFEYLKNNLWLFTEKIHGTNIRICLANGGVFFRGRTNKAEIYKPLFERLHFLMPDSIPESLVGKIVGWEGELSVPPVTLFGEGYGKKIQKEGVLYNPDGVDFILFDVLVGDHIWLDYDSVLSVGNELGLRTVPLVKVSSLVSALQIIRNGTLRSAFGDFRAEGIVGTPTVPIRDMYGRRIQIKLKHCDFGYPMRLEA